jgi:hypothetical protein
VTEAEAQVFRAEQDLSNRLQEATTAGKESAEKLLNAAKPALIGAAIVLGVVVVASLFRGSRRRSIWQRPAQRSLFGEIARAAALSLASSAARNFGERYLSAAAHTSPPGRLAPPQPSAR